MGDNVAPSGAEAQTGGIALFRRRHTRFWSSREQLLDNRARLFKQVREGDGPKDMLEAGVMKGLARTWKDPEKFLYDAAKGLWAHHDKLDPNVV